MKNEELKIKNEKVRTRDFCIHFFISHSSFLIFNFY
jgi:hypothetical protein